LSRSDCHFIEIAPVEKSFKSDEILAEMPILVVVNTVLSLAHC